MLALASLAALNAVLKYSSFGRRIRATVQNRELAETMGVSTRNVDRITFFLGSGLAGVGGVAIALISGTNPTLGTTYIIPAFLVVVAGGVGQLKGTLIAAWVVGVVTAYLTDWTSGSMAQVITFALVVVFLQVRPQGLFTVRTRASGMTTTRPKPDPPDALRRRRAVLAGASWSRPMAVSSASSSSPSRCWCGRPAR